MKALSSSLLSVFLLAGGLWAQEQAVLDIALHPAIQVTGDVGSAYVIESKTELPGDVWVERVELEMTEPAMVWFDPEPVGNAKRFYRAVKVTTPGDELVWCPPGTFTMGSPSDERSRREAEGPQTEVTLTQGFWLGKYEVTQGQYEAVMGNNPSKFAGDPGRPVEQVSYTDAVAYCDALTELERTAGSLPTGYEYRLPTEAQWEYACRAGTSTRFCFGDSLDCDDGNDSCSERDDYMVWGGNDNGRPERVGTKLPNPWGFHDMHGNLGEWCSGWYAEGLPGGSVTDPTGPNSGSIRVYRGGTWKSDARYCRSANRSAMVQGASGDARGFRVALVEVP